MMINHSDPLDEASEVMKEILEENAVQPGNTETQIIPTEFDDRDKANQKVGQAQAFELLETITSQLKYRAIQNLEEMKAHSHFGFKTHKEFCKVIGVGERTGASLKKWIRTLGLRTFQVMLRAGIKKKDIDFITSKHQDVKIEKEGKQTIIEIAGVKCQSTNREAIETAVKELQDEIKKEKKAKENAEKITKEAQEKITELEMKLDIPVDEKEFNNILDVHHVDLLRWVQKLKKIKKKAAGNDQLETMFNTIIQKCSSYFTAEMPKLNF
jgi:hypothetical protein